jgi:hypothetical protein
VERDAAAGRTVKGMKKETKERREGLRRRGGRGALEKGNVGKAKRGTVQECLAKGMSPKVIAGLMLITVREVLRLAKELKRDSNS